ncbi:hypothetical protein B0T25DRAFT_300470 [Lasiosphaeria hispida]|uniref:Uncharacterized protein n=1 Tax=Lasiosphaeria hispida TaxID=260671 RepID=A0AAJ0M900_9PEZI|nr:hypothetical protein B0T25DRAFT_300470 [Lasiosphaeria hispida]
MLGKLLLTLDALGLLLGAPIADYSHTHIFNPGWPPHAKFHCAQTITLSVLLGLLTLYYTWRPTAATGRSSRDSLRTATLTGTIYWAAGMVAILFPGTDGIDPEFGPPGFPQLPAFAVFMGLGLVGGVLEGGVLG